MPGASVTPNSFNLALANQSAISAITANAIPKEIMLPAATVTPSSTPTYVIQLQNVGLARGVLIKVTATIANNDGANAITPTNFGPLNLFSQVVYNDLSNFTRIQTTVPHLFMVDAARRKQIPGAAYTNDYPTNSEGGFGSNWTVASITQSIAHGATGTVQMYIYVPIMYSDSDMRGAVFMNVTNASSSIALTFNPAPGAATGTDPINAVYQGSASVAITSATIQAYQLVWDQLPDYRYLPAGVSAQTWQQVTGDATGYMLPNWSMKYMYEFKYSPFPGLTAGVENPFLYTNQRAFLSTIVQYNNGAGAPYRAVNGTDLSYLRLVSANSYEWLRVDPTTQAYKVRRLVGDDFPFGFYLFDSRNRPINTVVSGNMSLVIYPLVATAGVANAVLYYEDFGLISSVSAGTSLSSGV